MCFASQLIKYKRCQMSDSYVHMYTQYTLQFISYKYTLTVKVLVIFVLAFSKLYQGIWLESL